MISYFFRQLNLLNIILLIVITSLALLTYKEYKSDKPIDMGVEASVTPPITAKDKKENPSPEKALSKKDYEIISEKNIFHPDRKLEKIEKIGPSGPFDTDRFVVYGAIIAGDTRFVIVGDRKSPRKRNGNVVRHQKLKEGDSLNGYLVKSITNEKVQFQKGETVIDIDVDSPKQGRRQAVKTIQLKKPKKVKPIKPNNLPNKIPQKRY